MTVTAKAKLISYNEASNEPKTDMLFGIWKDQEENNAEKRSVDDMVQNMRKGRNFNH